MKLSELIEKLKKVAEVIGDGDVWVEMADARETSLSEGTIDTVLVDMFDNSVFVKVR
jgi:tRNA A58 N-methylase Trm61